MLDAPGPDQPDGRRLLHWPIGYSPDFSDLWAVGETDFAARPEAVFAHLTDLCRRAQDVPPLKGGPVAESGSPGLRTDSEFTYRLAGLEMRAQVGECSPGRRLAWFARGIDLGLYQEWLLLARGGRTLVLVGIAARGPAAIARREADAACARRLVAEWLRRLKAQASRGGQASNRSGR
ncbi:SRPBCC family protein [Streptomyces olivaceoviridis]